MNIDFFRKILEPLNFRGKARLLHTISPKQGQRRDTIFGYQINLDLADYIQRSIYLRTFEPLESSWVKNYLKAGMTFVDVGANIGYFTLMASSLVGIRGRVIAFEPSPYAWNRLNETVKINNLNQVIVMESGLSDVSGNIDLFVPKTIGNHNSSMIPNDSGNALKVKIQRLDEYLDMNEIDHIDLMKIDVEGFEPNVISGAGKYIESGKIRSILCEFNKYWLEANGSSPQIFFDLILRNGYQIKSGNFDPNCGLQNLLFSL